MPTVAKQIAYNPMTMAIIAITSPIVLSFIVWVLNMTIFKKIDGVDKRVTDVQSKFQEYQLDSAKTLATKEEMERYEEKNDRAHGNLHEKINKKKDA